MNPGTRERPLAAAGPEIATCCLRRDGGATSRARGPHAPYEQVHDHPDLTDSWGDDQERVDLLGEIRGRERREEVHQVADGGNNEDDAQRSGEESRLEGEIPKGREPQAKEDLRGEGPKVLDLDQDHHDGI